MTVPVGMLAESGAGSAGLLIRLDHALQGLGKRVLSNDVFGRYLGFDWLLGPLQRLVVGLDELGVPGIEDVDALSLELVDLGLEDALVVVLLVLHVLRRGLDQARCLLLELRRFLRVRHYLSSLILR